MTDQTTRFEPPAVLKGSAPSTNPKRPFMQQPIAAQLLVETVGTELARSQMAKSNR